MQKLKIMLPAYNEELSLPSLLYKIENFKQNYPIKVSVTVINDGSRDNTIEIAREKADSVLDIQPNAGLANALNKGLRYCLEDMQDEDILVTMDADDSHSPSLIYRMMLQINEGSDIVIASRYRPGARILGLTFTRKTLSLLASIMFQITTPMKGVRDFTCGYRAYNVAFLRKMLSKYGDKLIEQKGFGCMAELLIKSKSLNPIIHELPFILRYDLKKGGSKMNVIKTIKETLGLILNKNGK